MAELSKTIPLEQPDVLPVLYWNIQPYLRDTLQVSGLDVRVQLSDL